MTSRIASFPSRDLLQKTLRGQAGGGVPGHLFAARRHAGDSRKTSRQFTDLRVRVGNLQTMNQGTAPYDIDFAIRGPDLIALNNYSERLRARGHERHSGPGRRRYDAAPQQARASRRHRSRARGRPGRRRLRYRVFAAHHGRRRRRGFPLSRQRVGGGIRRRSPSEGRRPRLAAR